MIFHFLNSWCPEVNGCSFSLNGIKHIKAGLYLSPSLFFFFLMESKSFRECPKSALMSLSANVSTGTFTLAKYKSVVSAPSAVCIRKRWLRIRYSPRPSAHPCQGGRGWLEIFGANVSFYTPMCDSPTKLMWMLFSSWMNLWNPCSKFYSKMTKLK